MSRYSIDWNREMEEFTEEDYDKIMAETAKIIEEGNADIDLLSGAFYDRGLVYDLREDSDSAISNYTSVIQINDLAEEAEQAKTALEAAYYNCGYIYANLNLYKNAISDFKKALEIFPNDIDAKECLDWAETMFNKNR